MEDNTEFSNKRNRNFRHCRSDEHRAHKRFGFGLVVLVIGLLILLKQLGFNDLIPIRSFWPYILIVIGLIIGVKSGFRSSAPFILILIGAAHAIPAFHFTMGDTVVYSRKLVMPLVLIGAGVFFLYISRKKKFNYPGPGIQTSNKDFVTMDVMFGGSKEIVTSKNLTGSDISAVFGGAELNFSQADTAQDVIYFNVRTVFGGCEIILPPHWEVKNEMFVALGSAEDQRMMRQPDTSSEKKTVVRKGVSMFGRVEIQAY